MFQSYLIYVYIRKTYFYAFQIDVFLIAFMQI